MAEQWLSIVEYARTFALSDMTVRRRIKNGKLQAILRDGKYYIPMASERSEPRMPPSVPQHYGHEIPPPPPMRHPRPHPKASDEMVVVKASTRPAPQHYVPEPPAPRSEPPRPAWNRQNVQGSAPRDHVGPIPNNIRTSLGANETSLVNTQALLAFCESTLQRLEGVEKQVAGRFESKIQELEATIKAKDAEIKNLCQQVEDLQLLVKIFEKKTKSAS